MSAPGPQPSSFGRQMIRQATPSAEVGSSWWIGLDREAFSARVKANELAMRRTEFGSLSTFDYAPNKYAPHSKRGER